ncbi:transcription/translation regulatory transformer protein RfaH [Wenzhouxiangella sp. EGI_FJ10409]|uniref:transcription/translation regulatory transformer protein RfaH n=1 Tax=Wenzhouxiangella sp. EGI_FJ10409 TaxID=3243767 RepID=UPI0035D6C6B8
MQDQRHWRAIFCRPGQERRAEAHLENQEFEVFLPRIRARTRPRGGQSRVRVLPMFPRYLFVNLCAHAEDWSTIRSTRGAIGLVRFGDRVPWVPDEFIDFLKQRHDNFGAVDMSRAMEIKPNDAVEITDGAMAGLRAIFQARSGKDRVVVLLKLLEHERKVELPENTIRKVI